MTNGIRPSLVSLLRVAVVSAALAACPLSQAAEGTVVYHINDSASAAALLVNVGNHLAAAPDNRIHVVSHGRGIDFLLREARDGNGEIYANKVKVLADKGVQFKVCRNTLRGRKLDDNAVEVGVIVVPAGVVEIARLQLEEKAAYIKP